MRTHAFPPLLVVAATVGVDVCSVPSNNVVRDSEFLAAMGQKWTVILRKHTDAYRFCDKFGVLQKFSRVSVNLVLFGRFSMMKSCDMSKVFTDPGLWMRRGRLGTLGLGRIPCCWRLFPPSAERKQLAAEVLPASKASSLASTNGIEKLQLPSRYEL